MSSSGLEVKVTYSLQIQVRSPPSETGSPPGTVCYSQPSADACSILYTERERVSEHPYIYTIISNRGNIIMDVCTNLGARNT